MARPLVLRHPSSLRHDTGAHPERAARITAIERELEPRDWLGWEMRESVAADRSLVEAVHPAGYVDAIEQFCAAGGGNLDLDTVAGTDSFEAALHAAGGAAEVVDVLLENRAPVAASLHRPPGHHAEMSRAMGFCLFNNVAIAARRAIDGHGLERVLILDWDVHHGNGTNDIFHTDPQVLFVSIHQWPLYPGTGALSDEGSGTGEGFTVNLPVPGGSGDALWCSLVEHVVGPLASAFAPQLVLVSAGYDAHADDPLAGCEVTDEGYATMAGSVRRLAESLGVPLGLILEGGYDLGALSRSVARTLEVLGAPEAPPAPDLPVHATAGEAASRLAARWPALA
jgi:acetoin utilization deacetylase AcuC-like enzyme